MSTTAFQHLASNENYKTVPAWLRMNVIHSHRIDPVDFELWCVAVSAINGCSICVDSHEKVVHEKELERGGCAGCDSPGRSDSRTGNRRRCGKSCRSSTRNRPSHERLKMLA